MQAKSIFFEELTKKSNSSIRFMAYKIYKMNRRIYFYFLCLMLISVNSFSQEIKGDVLWVNTFTPATIKFPENIMSAEATCSDGMYQLNQKDNKLVISPVAEKKTTALHYHCSRGWPYAYI